MRIILAIFLLVSLLGNAQNALRFSEEVKQLQEKYKANTTNTTETIVFTGSSSVRLWGNLETVFPNHNVINSGFGGSTAEDLLWYTDELILAYNPKKVFIYEGDNDIAGKTNTKTILKNIKAIIQKIKTKGKTTQIVLIAAKPSIARWGFKKEYKKLNRKLKRLTKKDKYLAFADVWKPMLNGRKVKIDIFRSDNLHMNAKGYQIWYNVIKNHIN